MTPSSVASMRLASSVILVTLCVAAQAGTWPPQQSPFDAATAARSVYYAAAAYTDNPQGCLTSMNVNVTGKWGAVDFFNNPLFAYTAVRAASSESTTRVVLCPCMDRSCFCNNVDTVDTFCVSPSLCCSVILGFRGSTNLGQVLLEGIESTLQDPISPQYPAAMNFHYFAQAVAVLPGWAAEFQRT